MSSDNAAWTYLSEGGPRDCGDPSPSTEMSASGVEDALKRDWLANSKAIYIGSPTKWCISVFFNDNDAVVLGTDFKSGLNYSSRGCATSDSQYVRLSREDSDDFSFAAWQIVSKTFAWAIVSEFIRLGTAFGLCCLDDGSRNS